MADTQDGLKLIFNKLENYQRYEEFKEKKAELIEKKGEAFEQLKEKITKPLGQWEENKTKWLDEKKTLFDDLLDTYKLSRKQQNSDIDNNDPYLKKVFIKSVRQVEPQIKTILSECIVKALGCTIDQEIQQNQTLYIKTQSVDLFNIFEISPDEKIGKLYYEQKPINYNSLPFSMNRELYKLVQDINQPFSVPAGNLYLGTSNTQLFDITYVESYIDPINGPQIGSFYKVQTGQRPDPLTVDKFLLDYYSTLGFLDYKTLLGNLANIITGCISKERNEGYQKIAFLQKLNIFIQRIFGLCFDSNKEIDTSGTAKVSENDNIDDSFFELTDFDLRFIEQKTSDIKLGVIEFEDCENVKVPMNTEALIDSILQITFNEDNVNNQIDQAADVLNNITDDSFRLSLDLEFIKQFPKAIVQTILSPKVILPIMIVVKALGQEIGNQVRNAVEFFRLFKSFVIEFVSRIGGLFIKILFDIIKKDVRTLVSGILRDIVQEKKDKLKSMTTSLIAIASPLLVLGAIKSFRECQSIINQIEKILSLVQGSKSGSTGRNPLTPDIPLPLLYSAKYLDGFSSTRAYLNILQRMQRLGIPTEPMPDGTPNQFLLVVQAIVEGIDQEMSENGKVAVALPPLTVTPLFFTTPQKVYGKVI
jgi:hypothetical protein